MQEASPITTQADFVPFTEEMRKTHTILVPGMLPLHFSLMQAALASCGYKVEVLQDTGREVVETGLKYVNNDICYPLCSSLASFCTPWKAANIIWSKLL